MARPIEPTPTLEGEDAEALLRSLDDVATPEEMDRRVQASKQRLAEMEKRRQAFKLGVATPTR
ncbi:MAG: hypothetical protein IT381_10385 [Deltaproteobacteria bacterium]|nr:hypothetical protein [Deltaproteobacteria bacterium]